MQALGFVIYIYFSKRISKTIRALRKFTIF